jgi:peroxiredoxin
MQSLRAPDFTLPDLEGRPHALFDYRGKKVFLVFWASW